MRTGPKKGVDLEEARRKREDNVIELRKTKREENLLKKRQTFAAPQYALEDSNKPGGGVQRVGARMYYTHVHVTCKRVHACLLGASSILMPT